MTLWRVGEAGEPERFIPSEYVFEDMEPGLAHVVLGRLLDLLWETGKLSDAEVIEILGLPGLSMQPTAPKKTKAAE